VVDEIDEGCFDRISFVKIKKVSPMRLKLQESADWVGEVERLSHTEPRTGSGFVVLLNRAKKR
jgi:hypothetical protein